VRQRRKFFDMVVLALALGIAAVLALQHHRKEIAEQSTVDEVRKDLGKLTEPDPGSRIQFEEPQLWTPAMAQAQKRTRCSHVQHDKNPLFYAELADPGEGKYVSFKGRSKRSIRALERLLTRGSAYADRGQDERAIEDYTQALEYDPDDFRLHLHLAYAYSSLKDYPRALVSINRALILEPGLATAYGDRAWYLQKLGQTKLSEDDWSVFVAVKPNEDWEYTGLAGELYRRELYTEAEAAADASLEFGTDSGGVGVKGKLLLNRGEPLQALHYFDLGVERSPHSANYHERRAEALEALGRVAEAAEARAEVERLNSEVLD
jgi:tetratricopeptide (TPR) repeat protein